MDITVSHQSPESQNVDALVLGVYQGRQQPTSTASADKSSKGALLKTAKKFGFDGKPGQTVALNNIEGIAADRIILTGLGKGKSTNAKGFRKAAAAAATLVNQGQAKTSAIFLADAEIDGKDSAWRLRNLAHLAMLSTYRFEACKGDKHESSPVKLKRVKLGVGKKPTAGELQAAKDGAAIGQGTNLARDLGNLPGNICTPTYLGERAKELGRKHAKLSVQVRGEKEIERLKMGSFLSVAKGSRQPPRLITLDYKGGQKSDAPIVLVGKGVTFDSGGISLKPGGGMDEMKFDMCGAASVFGTISAVAEMGLPMNVIGLVPATENLPDGNASKPGDIFTSMSGQTIEVLNTDAEGRLILCDALTFAERFKPAAVVDIATLTGACVVALGSHATGLFSNDDKLANELLSAGETSDDRAWRMPMWAEYGEQLKSNFADVANIGGREAGAVTAACFLERFASKFRWAHLDIAGTAWNSGKSKGSTGRPVGLLTQYLLDRLGAKKRAAR